MKPKAAFVERTECVRIHLFKSQLLYQGQAQAVGVVGLDGMPVTGNGDLSHGILWQNHLGIPPVGRIEFMVKGPEPGIVGELVTRSVNTGAVGEGSVAAVGKACRQTRCAAFEVATFFRNLAASPANLGPESRRK